MNETGSARENAPEDVRSRVRTVDGTRIEIDDINVGTSLRDAEMATGSWFKKARLRLAQFLAGMYTGVGCSGVPHAHHTYGPDRDNRPL